LSARHYSDEAGANVWKLAGIEQGQAAKEMQALSDIPDALIYLINRIAEFPYK